MVLDLKKWELVKERNNIISDMQNNLGVVIDDCGYQYSNHFLINCVDKSNSNKSSIIGKLGGVELYAMAESDIITNDIDTVAKFCDALAKLVAQSWGDMADKHYTCKQIQACLNDYDVVLKYMSLDNMTQKIEVLKKHFGELEFVSRLRKTLPKESRVISNILTYIVEKHTLDSSLLSLIPVIIDTLGSTKKKQYIVVLSTVPSAIYTASVSNYFGSCYDIRDKGHCYASSVSYLALDKYTAILKIFEATEDNLNLLNTGGIGALSSSNKALARRFVFFNDNETDSLVILGKAYPNDQLLNGDYFSKEIYKLYTNTTDNVTTKPLLSHQYSTKVYYSEFFNGYCDLLEKDGLITHKSDFTEYDIDNKFNSMLVGDNGICTIDTGEFIKYTMGNSNIGYNPCYNDD